VHRQCTNNNQLCQQLIQPPKKTRVNKTQYRSLPTLLPTLDFTLPTSYSAHRGRKDIRHFLLYFTLPTLLPTLDFTLPTSYSAHSGRRISPNVIPCQVHAPIAWNLRGMPLARTEDTEDAETFVTSSFISRFLLYFRLPHLYFLLRMGRSAHCNRSYPQG
jgi:hypothetical protein